MRPGTASCWFDERAEHADRGRLASTVRAEDAEGLTGRHAQRDAAHGFGAVLVGLGEVFEHDCVGRSTPGRDPLGARDTDELVQGTGRGARGGGGGCHTPTNVRASEKEVKAFPGTSWEGKTPAKG